MALAERKQKNVVLTSFGVGFIAAFTHNIPLLVLNRVRRVRNVEKWIRR